MKKKQQTVIRNDQQEVHVNISRYLAVGQCIFPMCVNWAIPIRVAGYLLPILLINSQCSVRSALAVLKVVLYSRLSVK